MRSLTSELENRVKNEGIIKKETLTNEEWKQLWIVENPGTSKMEEIFGQKYKTIYNYITRKIGNYRSFIDEEFIFRILLQIKISSLNTDSVTRDFFSTILLNKTNEIYKKENGKYISLYNVEELWEKQQKILDYNYNHKEHIENFIDEYLYELYIKIKEDNFSSWMYDRYYMDPEELDSMKFETLEMIKNTNFLEIRNKFLRFDDCFDETEEVKLKEFQGNTVRYVKNKRNSNRVKIDYEKANRSQKEVGDSGEEEVLKLLRKRFKNNKKLLNKIEHIAKEDDSKGYDISYIDENGFENYIEVKTNSNATNDRFTFYISKSEDEFLRKNERSSIYYVKLFPKVEITKIPREKYLEMEKEVITYLVDVECF